MTTPEDKFDEERLAGLLRELAEPPAAWIEAAKEAPRARREIDDIVTRAEADAEFRKQLLEDLETALRDAGQEPDRQRIAALRARLLEDG